MKFFIKIITILVVIYPYNSTRIYAQCCASGNPSAFNLNMIDLEEYNLRIAIEHIYSFSDTYYNKTSKLDKQYMESYFNFSSISIDYKLTDELTILSKIGYFANKSQKFIDEDYLRYAQGIGDADVGMKYLTFINSNEDFRVHQTMKITLPIGKFNQEYKGVILPIDLQASSGNYKYKLRLDADYIIRDIGLFIYSSAAIEFSSMIETEFSYHKYGNLINLIIGSGYSISDDIFASINLNFENRDKALNSSKTNENQYSYINSTGGLILFLSPSIYYKLLTNTNLFVNSNIPIYKNVNGQQLTNKYSISLGISKQFSI